MKTQKKPGVLYFPSFILAYITRYISKISAFVYAFAGLALESVFKLLLSPINRLAPLHTYVTIPVRNSRQRVN